MRLMILKVNTWRGDSESEEGLIWHAVEELQAIHGGPALCGVQPVRGWSWQLGAAVTCLTCLRIKTIIEGPDLG